MKRHQVYICDPEILSGTPCFVGTRVPIRTLLDYLRHGKTISEFRDDFPSVTDEQATALLELAEDELVAEV